MTSSDSKKWKISLTETERELFDLLLRAVQHYQQQHKKRRCDDPADSSTPMSTCSNSGKSSIFAAEKLCEEQTVLRVAGGWVRDKLLQRTSQDIDIALNNMSGVEFAQCVNDYLSLQGMETRTIAVIQANPDQSKHLETANLRVLGFEIDCVNLRAETYADTRIPEVRIGTALEDALRRDFTINALFYNINTDEVEDFCGQGLEDLQAGIIRTPISPFTTFLDDPLRVLRAVRFCARFNFTLCDELLSAAREPSIREALMRKVSRERVYKELEGMVYNNVGPAHVSLAQSLSVSQKLAPPTDGEREHTIGCRPALAFAILHRMQLLDAVLCLDDLQRHYPILHTQSSTLFPALLSSEDTKERERLIFPSVSFFTRSSSLPQLGEVWSKIAIETVLAVNLLLSHTVLPHSRDEVSHFFTEDSQWTLRHGPHVKALFYAALCLSIQPLCVSEKKKEVSFVPVALRDSLKMDSATMRSAQTVMEVARGFIRVDQTPRADSTSAAVDLDSAALLLRHGKELWREGLLLAAAFTIVSQRCEGFASVEAVMHAPSLAPKEGPWFHAVEKTPLMLHTIERFQEIERTIDALALDGCWNTKPLMDGSALMRALSLPKGPIVGQIMEAQLQWQIRTRSTDTQACVRYLQEQFNLTSTG